MGDNGIRWTPEVNFWPRVDQSDGPDACWPWTGSKNPDGYGRTTRHRHRLERTHRVVWELTHGPVPPRMHVLHHCDNPPCCNPAHLFLGTQRVNNADRHQKGRSRGPTEEAHPSRKLTKIAVLEIRRLRALRIPPSYAVLARRFGTSDVAIRQAALGKTWKTVGGGANVV